MLEQTFVHVRGIGHRTERRLWEEGADSWEAFLRRPTAFSLPRECLPAALDVVSRSPGALARGDWRFFRQRLPATEHWRALRAFPDRVLYLDIETNGTREDDAVTVIGVYDGTELRQFVRGENLLDFPNALEDAALLVTFYGTGFDIPMLRRCFPSVEFDRLHLDLCPALRRLGLRGGLKAVEQQVGLRRAEETAGLSGWDAVLLWEEWRRGSREALERLLAYNADDVLNLVPLADLAFRRLAERLRSEAELP